MTKLDTQERIINIICNDLVLDVKRNDVTYDSSLFDDFSLDSIKLIELFTMLEGEFSIELDDDDMDFRHFMSVNTLASFVDDVVARQ